MNHPPAFDPGIPVLTEVFQDQPARDGSHDAAATAAPAQPVAGRAGLEAGAADNWTGPRWNELEDRLSERILNRLRDRIDFALEQHLREGMEEALHHAMADLTGEIRRGLQQTIERIVVRAVAQELTHMQTLKE